MYINYSINKHRYIYVGTCTAWEDNMYYASKLNTYFPIEIYDLCFPSFICKHIIKLSVVNN